MSYSTLMFLISFLLGLVRAGDIGLTNDCGCFCNTFLLVEGELRRDFYVDAYFCKEVILSLESLSVTKIHYNAFSGFASLNTLQIRSSAISEFPEGLFAGLDSLEYLFINDNAELAILPEALFIELPNLKVLSLEGNKIDTLPPAIFDPLDSLQSLNLRENQFTIINSQLFSSLPNLPLLNLDSNRLVGFEASSFASMSNLRQLSFGDNILDCCQVRGLQDLPDSLYYGSFYQCVAANGTTLSFHSNIATGSLNTFIEGGCICEHGFYTDVFGECAPCTTQGTNCVVGICYGDGTYEECSECDPGYAIDPNSGNNCQSCTLPNPNCNVSTPISCSSTGFYPICESCLAGYEIENDDCRSCSDPTPFCDVIVPDTCSVHDYYRECEICTDGAYLNETFKDCTLCPEENPLCTISDELVCSLAGPYKECHDCNVGFYVQDGMCLGCNDPTPHCLVEDPDCSETVDIGHMKKCQVCEDGYFINATIDCQENIPCPNDQCLNGGVCDVTKGLCNCTEFNYGDSCEYCAKKQPLCKDTSRTNDCAGDTAFETCTICNLGYFVNELGVCEALSPGCSQGVRDQCYVCFGKNPIIINGVCVCESGNCEEIEFCDEPAYCELRDVNASCFRNEFDQVYAPCDTCESNHYVDYNDQCQSCSERDEKFTQCKPENLDECTQQGYTCEACGCALGSLNTELDPICRTCEEYGHCRSSDLIIDCACDGSLVTCQLEGCAYGYWNTPDDLTCRPFEDFEEEGHCSDIVMIYYKYDVLNIICRKADCYDGWALDLPFGVCQKLLPCSYAKPCRRAGDDYALCDNIGTDDYTCTCNEPFEFDGESCTICDPTQQAYCTRCSSTLGCFGCKPGWADASVNCTLPCTADNCTEALCVGAEATTPSCLTCDDGFYRDIGDDDLGLTDCKQCAEGCALCQAPAECNKCEPGLLWDYIQRGCVNPLNCSATLFPDISGGTCTDCYFMCEKCDTASQFNCTKCIDNYEGTTVEMTNGLCLAVASAVDPGFAKSAIYGIVAGVMVFVVMVAIIALYVHKQRKRRENDELPEGMSPLDFVLGRTGNKEEAEVKPYYGENGTEFYQSSLAFGRQSMTSAEEKELSDEALQKQLEAIIAAKDANPFKKKFGRTRNYKYNGEEDDLGDFSNGLFRTSIQYKVPIKNAPGAINTDENDYGSFSEDYEGIDRDYSPGSSMRSNYSSGMDEYNAPDGDSYSHDSEYQVPLDDNDNDVGGYAGVDHDNDIVNDVDEYAAVDDDSTGNMSSGPYGYGYSGVDEDVNSVGEYAALTDDNETVDKKITDEEYADGEYAAPLEENDTEDVGDYSILEVKNGEAIIDGQKIHVGAGIVSHAGHATAAEPVYDTNVNLNSISSEYATAVCDDSDDYVSPDNMDDESCAFEYTEPFGQDNTSPVEYAVPSEVDAGNYEDASCAALKANSSMMDNISADKDDSDIEYESPSNIDSDFPVTDDYVSVDEEAANPSTNESEYCEASIISSPLFSRLLRDDHSDTSIDMEDDTDDYDDSYAYESVFERDRGSISKQSSPRQQQELEYCEPIMEDENPSSTSSPPPPMTYIDHQKISNLKNGIFPKKPKNPGFLSMGGRSPGRK